MRTDLDSIVAEYNRISSGLGRAIGGSREYREIRFADWPAPVHYEFVARTDSFQLELHYQLPDQPSVAEAIQGLLRGAQVTFSRYNPVYSPSASKTHRIAMYLPADFGAGQVANEMHHFIAWSRPILDRAMYNHGLEKGAA